MRRILSVVTAHLLISLFSISASAQSSVTIDFEDAPPEFASGNGFNGTYESQGFDLVSTYCCWGTIGQPAVLTNKAMLFGSWGFNFNLYGYDFTLEQFDVGFLQGYAGQVVLQGYRDGVQVAYEVIDVPAADPLPFYQTIVPGPGFENLDRLGFSMDANNCCPGDPSALDNIVLTSGIKPVEVTVNPETPAGNVHPHHDGSPSAVAGLDDLINVVVHGSLEAVGDPVDFDASEIDAATLKVGPGEGGMAPGTSPTFGVDWDSDGIDDARIKVLTSDSGIQCTDTEVAVTGEASVGEPFAGVGSITADCDSLCHN